MTWRNKLVCFTLENMSTLELIKEWGIISGSFGVGSPTVYRKISQGTLTEGEGSVQLTPLFRTAASDIAKIVQLFTKQATSMRRPTFLSFSVPCGQDYKLFTAVITPLVAYFSMILTELRQ